MLDTTIISDLVRNPAGLAARRVEKVGHEEIFTSIVVAAELRYGCAKKGSPRLLARIESVLDTIPVLPLDVPMDTEYGGIRAALEAAGQPIGLNDFMVCAHAYACGSTLVTGKARDFSRVRGLKVQNWLER